ncbi:PcfK-like protein [Prevotella sp. tc2-28]|nr:PcfK-like protein [Prevotella sp. tc2-28]
MYLTAKAYKDEGFMEIYGNPKKNLDECVLYIQAKMLEKVTEEQKKGGAAVVIPSDDEIFALAVQYYVDTDIKVDGDRFDNVKLVSAAATTFSEEEKQKMRQEAIKKYQDDVIAEMKKKDEERRKKAAQAKKPTSPTLIPDTKETGAEPKQEAKEPALQMDLFQ